MRPYYAHAGIVIYHGDCRDIVPRLPTFDLVVTDPPYGVQYDGGRFHSGDTRIKRAREKLAGDDEDVYRWAVPMMLNQCRGPCYFFYAAAKSFEILRAVSDAKGQVHAVIVWHKTNAKYAAMGSQYKNRCQLVLYCKGKQSRTFWIGPTTESTFWDMDRDAANNYHPTQKPVAVMKRAIQNHRGELIVDPFMGAGSTLRAAADLGRRAIGIELNESYCKIAAERLRQKTLF